MEGSEHIKAAYGATYDRLVALKNTYDPINLFRLNPNIKLAVYAGPHIAGAPCVPTRLVGRGPRQQVRRQVWCRWGGLPIPHLTHAGFVWRDATAQPWVNEATCSTANLHH